MRTTQSTVFGGILHGIGCGEWDGGRGPLIDGGIDKADDGEEKYMSAVLMQ